VSVKRFTGISYLGDREAKLSRPDDHLHLKHVTSRRARLNQLLQHVLPIQSTAASASSLLTEQYIWWTYCPLPETA